MIAIENKIKESFIRVGDVLLVQTKSTYNRTHDMESDFISIFVKGNFSTLDEDIVDTSDAHPYKYAISGSQMDIILITEGILNSQYGKLCNGIISSNQINIKNLKNIRVPVISSERLALLLFLFVMSKVLKGLSYQFDKSEFEIMETFFNMVKEYCILEIYIPTWFQERGISIFEQWMNHVGNCHIEISEGTPSEEMVKLLFRSLVKNGQGLLESMNKMKAYQQEIAEILRNRTVVL